ncbi:hypothetical protein SAICODRAFT_8321 [Saitoella complicata NRRL Y-17804]|uniref:uncharacterized protein n=1 Tax=Saitoella complicata (strain BCRC 22490 / CBS 7301 / JCM 7358 / NBRC 10748 / NRRL Y-17804) TaxID=698492 RepID=UPI000866FBB6|nr:uncharacterized protein SAICODRAFT_8321 [Saitoella complicata NRRL Y-17804]ODQ52108.1 hypothetical protein SAICODRAFT_8321 [Saitoella complicata NRRL Y-17804]
MASIMHPQQTRHGASMPSDLAIPPSQQYAPSRSPTPPATSDSPNPVDMKVGSDIDYPETPITAPATPPTTPPLTSASLVPSVEVQDITPLSPASKYPYFSSALPDPIRELTADQLAIAMTAQCKAPLLDSKIVFPWAHGLHPSNRAQCYFFAGANPSALRPPQLSRSLLIIRVGPSNSRKAWVRGAVRPDEVLDMIEDKFLEADVRVGVGLRNFGIQVRKWVRHADVVVYGAPGTKTEEVVKVARRVCRAQEDERRNGNTKEEYATFLMADPFEAFEQKYFSLVSVSSKGMPTPHALDFLSEEREQMRILTTASPIAPNVYMGNTADLDSSPYSSTPASPMIRPVGLSSTVATDADAGSTDVDDIDSIDSNDDLTSSRWDVCIEARPDVDVPSPNMLVKVSEALESMNGPSPRKTVHFDFPASGTLGPQANARPGWAERCLGVCKWLYEQTTGDQHGQVKEDKDGDGDVDMVHNKRRKLKVLLHCGDGYTETSLLGLMYVIYAHAWTAEEAWVNMHKEPLSRNFFAYPSDVRALNELEPLLLKNSPANKRDLRSLPRQGWFPYGMTFSKFDGSLPSRILPHLYLGNLLHASNPALLKQLGIRRIVSVGERPTAAECRGEDVIACKRTEQTNAGKFEWLYIDKLQDDGVDSLNGEMIEECLKFLDAGYRQGTPTLVHCRVGVSRSASICIAEVVRRLQISVPRAYLLARARRLNVIIQPNLRFMYELMLWEEVERKRRGEGGADCGREMEWVHLAREINALNQVAYGNSVNTAWVDPRYHVYTPSADHVDYDEEAIISLDKTPQMSREGAIGYCPRLGYAVVFGEPCAPDPARSEELLVSFLDFCTGRGLKPLFLSVRGPFADSLAIKGWNYMEFAKEQIIVPAEPEPRSRTKNLRRQLKNAMEQGHVEVYEYDKLNSPDPTLEKHIQELVTGFRSSSKARMKLYNSRLMPFAFEVYGRWFYAVVPGGTLVGLLTLTKLDGQSGFSIEHCITSPLAPRGTSELLISHASSTLRSYPSPPLYLSFGTSPLGHLGKLSVAENKLATKFARSAYKLIAKLANLQGKANYREKFGIGRQEKLFVVCRKGDFSLRMILAILLVCLEWRG